MNENSLGCIFQETLVHLVYAITEANIKYPMLIRVQMDLKIGKQATASSIISTRPCKGKEANKSLGD